MKNSIKNPYQNLLNKIRDFCFDVEHPHRVLMWFYPKEKLNSSSWCVADLFERTEAARQLGYNVVLKAADRGLEVWYEKRVIVPSF